MKRSGLEADFLFAQLQERGLMLMDGHFDYHNGYHGISYLTAQPLLSDPSEVISYAHDLADKIDPCIRDQVEMVVGPATGGMLFGFAMAIAIDRGRPNSVNYRKLLFAPIYKSGGTLALREYHQRLIAGEFQQPGKKVLIIDDVSNTGLTITRSRELIERCGGQVVGSAVLYDRQSTFVELPNHTSLATCEADPGLVPVERCGQCRLNLPITKF